MTPSAGTNVVTTASTGSGLGNQSATYLGNAAKAWVVADITEKLQASSKTLTLFDFGCGKGGEWSSILPKLPAVQFVGYDPSAESVRVAQSRLEGLGARFIEREELDGGDFRADIVVSFSVFEHVYDRPGYLRTAHRVLAPNG